jgi:Spy/CpxP family protein refolding chaperone
LAGALTGGLLGSLLAGTLSVYAQTFQGFGGWFHGGHGYCRARHVGSHDPAVVGERVVWATDRMLSRIDASEAQRQQIQTVVQAAVSDLLHVRDQHHKNRQAWLDALGQSSIDRKVLDDLRQVELQLADTASSRLVQAMADIADILTPAQRQELIEHLRDLRRWHGRP